MRLFFFTCLALLGSVVGAAAHEPVSGDNTAHPYSAQTPIYPTIPMNIPALTGLTWLPKLGTGTHSIPGGEPQAFSHEPPEIPSNFNVGDWKISPYNARPVKGEAKFRTHCNYSHHAFDDPIVAPGKPGGSHAHTFFGNNMMNANSTYKQLRLSYGTIVNGRVGTSTCGGGPINNSGYWYPAVLKDNAIGDGATMVLKPGVAVVYYNIANVNRNRLIRIPRGLNFVFGQNPSDITNSAAINEVIAANAASVAAGGRGSYVVPTQYNAGFAGWHCVDNVTPINGSNVNSPRLGNQYQPYLRNANGTVTLTCLASSTSYMVASLGGQVCWDGVNLTSPNGRSHVRFGVRENNTNKTMCPQGWYQIAGFELSIYFKHEGEADYKEWYLSSDRMPGATQFLNGQSMHSDWFGAWDYGVMQTWMQRCNGTNLVIGGTDGVPQDCGDTQFGDGTAGKTSSPAPDNSRPQVVNTNAAQYTGNARFDVMPGR